MRFNAIVRDHGRVITTLYRAIPGVLSGLAVLLGGVSPARAGDVATLTSLHSFAGEGAFPVAGLVTGTDGNLYGTTSNGGNQGGDGAVVQITPAGVLTTLHSFSGGSGGSQPFSGLVQGPNGMFYGTTSAGGDAAGDGTIYAVSATGTLTTVHAFTGADGSQPQAGPILNTDGNFYGTTTYGGTSGNGTVFRMTPAGAMTTLYNFTGGTDGAYPVSGLLRGADGNFYGAASAGGNANGDGTIYRITPSGVLTTLYTFNGTDGYQPVGGLVQGADGNLYGTTYEGGADGVGTVFQLTPAGGLTTLYSFTGATDGSCPYAGLTLGPDGRLYGTTTTGGSVGGDGTVFAITPGGALSTLYVFGGADGSQPQSALVSAGGGTFYGATSAGGTNGQGTIFQLSVAPADSAFFAGEVPLGGGIYYLTLASGSPFGFYTYLSDPRYLYHFDLGFEYVFDANDGNGGAYFYDFASNGFFYTSPAYPFPYLYDFSLNSVVYYYPDPTTAGHYTTAPRYFFDFATGTVLSK